MFLKHSNDNVGLIHH